MSSISKNTSSSSSSSTSFEDDLSLRRGPWTLQEDSLLVHYISLHGEGRWNLLAKCAGLRRTDKSCRLRWLNYLKPDVKRGNFSPHEQLLILDLHSKLGNRWSKIAKSLPGRTDNEIKNYWRTRVQKQAKHLKIDANSTVFQEIIRRFWMPRLLQKIQADSTISSSHPPVHYVDPPPPPPPPPPLPLYDPYSDSNTSGSSNTEQYCSITNMSQFYKSQTINPNFYDLDGQNITTNGSYVKDFYYHVDINENMLAVPGGLGVRHVAESDWVGSCDFGDNMWSMDQLMTI